MLACLISPGRRAMSCPQEVLWGTFVPYTELCIKVCNFARGFCGASEVRCLGSVLRASSGGPCPKATGFFQPWPC